MTPAKVKVSESGIKWLKSMLPITYKHVRYEKSSLKNLHVMSNVKVFAKRDGQLDECDSLRRSYVTHMDQKLVI